MEFSVDMVSNISYNNQLPGKKLYFKVCKPIGVLRGIFYMDVKNVT